MQLETMIWNIMSAGLLIATTLITWRDIRPGVAPAGRWVRPVLSRKRLIAILAASTLFAVTGLYLSFQIVLSHSQKIDRTSSFYLHMLLFTVILQYFALLRRSEFYEAIDESPEQPEENMRREA